jgi:hypothetical protein
MVCSSAMRVAVTVAVSTALLSSGVDAHGYLVQPAASSKDTTYNARIDSSTLGAPYAGKKWNDVDPTVNARTFATAFAASGEKSIKSMMDRASPGCGKTSTDGTPINVSGMNSIKWANDYEKKGFVTSHTGPCETWIDDVMVQHDIECVSKYPGYPANIPVNYSACKKAKCVLTFYWLALHEPMWQVYKQCAPITNGGGGRGGGGRSADFDASNSTTGGDGINNQNSNNEPYNFRSLDDY